MAGALVAEFTNDNFEADVLKSDVPVLVDFWAPWCGPCRMLAPAVETVAEKYEGRVKVGKLNTDENGPIATSYNISSIPALLVFSGGQQVDQIVGAVPPEKISELLDKHL